MKSQKTTIRDLAGALIRLNGISQGKAADLSNLTRQNVSSWFTGRENAISQESKLRLLDTLGVRYGQLRSDGIHRWCVEHVEDVELVLREVLSNDDRANCELWPVSNSRYKFCVILRIMGLEQPLWIMIYRPLMSEAPKIINSEALQFGRDMFGINIDAATWESWLPPAVIDPIAFNQIVTELINQFPYPAPPKYFSEISDDEDEDGKHGDELTQDELWALHLQKQDELKVWNQLLLQATLKGMKFDEVVSKTRTALDINV